MIGSKNTMRTILLFSFEVESNNNHFMNECIKVHCIPFVANSFYFLFVPSKLKTKKKKHRFLFRKYQSRSCNKIYRINIGILFNFYLPTIHIQWWYLQQQYAAAVATEEKWKKMLLYANKNTALYLCFVSMHFIWGSQKAFIMFREFIFIQIKYMQRTDHVNMKIKFFFFKSTHTKYTYKNVCLAII